MRCFLAIPLSASTSDSLVRASTVIREYAPAWASEKWVIPVNLHATVRFFGEIDEGTARRLSESIARVCHTAAPFSLPFASMRATPTSNRCRLIWAGFSDETQHYEDLVRGVDTALQAVLAPRVSSRFLPHVTLCRARTPRAIEATVLDRASSSLRANKTAMSVVSVTLYSSRLTPRGPVYEELRSWHLGGGE